MKFEKRSDGQYLLDVKGYVCPHPQLYTKKALGRLQAGEVLEVQFDNPSSGESIATMCDNTGDEILDRKQEAGLFVWQIRKI
ncbi:MAG: sulfurtransferase TusA family protein [Betaproteobacteria bacterium]|nr:sulfurtransferase TusA family protein [Betaproteobacteria bacterium]